METERIIAMAVAAIAEENKLDVKKIRVRSFREVFKSSLGLFIEKNHIDYHKYKLGDSN